MSRSLRTYITGLVGAAAIALLATGLVIPVGTDIALQLDGDTSTGSAIEVLAGGAFWTIVTLFASALPVRLTDGVQVAVSIAPLMAATTLGGPTAGALVALLGTTDMREEQGHDTQNGNQGH